MAHFFGLHSGHLTAKADKIARRHGALHVNYTEPNGRRRGWFECQNRGEPFDSETAQEVFAALDRAGGIRALTFKQDLTREERAAESEARAVKKTMEWMCRRER